MAKPLNIVLFLTDDHGSWALPAYGNREIVAPHLNRIAAEGATFRNAFTPCPVCSPARACLMTGRTPSQVGIHDWIREATPELGERDWLQDEITLPQLLQGAGYQCGLSGKWHLGTTHRAPSGFDWHFGLPGWQGRHIEEYSYFFNGENKVLSGNKTQIITDYALQFLENASASRPFFLNVGYIATHSPYANQESELVALYDDATFCDIPEYHPHPWHHNEGVVGGEIEREELRPYYANYYAAVTDMDRGVGRILRQLETMGALDNTLVIYTSDHGCALGHHGFWGKGNSTRPLNMYETSLRVPLLMRGPGVQAGSQIGDCVDHYDTFQTVNEVAGVELSENRDYPGRSFAPLLRGQTLGDWRQSRFGEYGDLRMLRTPEWKLVRRYPDGPDDLFDLENDAGETRNLAMQPEYSAVRLELLNELESWYSGYESAAHSGLKVGPASRFNDNAEAWRDGLREARGLGTRPN